jgi:hypothetical protein
MQVDNPTSGSMGTGEWMPIDSNAENDGRIDYDMAH